MSEAAKDRPGIAVWSIAALLLIALPLLAAWLSPARPGMMGRGGLAGALFRAGPVPPSVEPLELRQIAPETARQTNAAVPFSLAPNPPARPFHFAGDLPSLARATDCLAAAMLYEAGDDPEGERAVGQVVLNRLRHPAFPKTVCDVVFQGSQRTTGCQFTFTCDGAMARLAPQPAWQRARRLASAMLDGAVYRPVGYSTHYHTDWVVPYWSASLDKVAAVDTHLFFRWPGWWGTPGAFRERLAVEEEPRIASLALLSPEHQSEDGPALARAVPGSASPANSLVDDLAVPLALDSGKVGSHVAGARLIAVSPEQDVFAVLLEKISDPLAYERVAARYCAGRAQCRLMGWTDARQAPHAFPVSDGSVAAMSYAYLRVRETGLERSLYNCAEFKAAPVGQCMRARSLPEQAVHNRSSQNGLRSSERAPPSLRTPSSRLIADTPEAAPPTGPAPKP